MFNQIVICDEVHGLVGVKKMLVVALAASGHPIMHWCLGEAGNLQAARSLSLS